MASRATPSCSSASSSRKEQKQVIELKVAEELQPFESLNSFNRKRLSRLLESKDEMLKKCSRYITFNELPQHCESEDKDSDVIMIGKYECSGGKYFLKDLLEETNRKVELDLSNVNEFPQIGDFLEVWGKIETEASSVFFKVYFYTNWKCGLDLVNEYDREMKNMSVLSTKYDHTFKKNC